MSKQEPCDLAKWITRCLSVAEAIGGAYVYDTIVHDAIQSFSSKMPSEDAILEYTMLEGNNHYAAYTLAEVFVEGAMTERRRWTGEEAESE